MASAAKGRGTSDLSNGSYDEVPPDFKALEEHVRGQATDLPQDIPQLARALASRWLVKDVVRPDIVDVVSEFFVQELVAVDGDSLLSLCFQTATTLTPQESSTDSLGFHPLTLIYLVEQFLARLKAANLHFTITWFEDRSAVSTAASSDSTACQSASRRFVRQAVRNHLEGIGAPQASFQSIDSDDWRSWLMLERPYAMLMTDGSQSVTPEADGAYSISQGETGIIEALDTLALAQHLGGGLDGRSYGLSVVLLDSAMFDDHKILVSPGRSESSALMTTVY